MGLDRWPRMMLTKKCVMFDNEITQWHQTHMWSFNQIPLVQMWYWDVANSPEHYADTIADNDIWVSRTVLNVWRIHTKEEKLAYFTLYEFLLVLMMSSYVPLSRLSSDLSSTRILLLCLTPVVWAGSMPCLSSSLEVLCSFSLSLSLNPVYGISERNCLAPLTTLVSTMFTWEYIFLTC